MPVHATGVLYDASAVTTREQLGDTATKGTLRTEYNVDPEVLIGLLRVGEQFMAVKTKGGELNTDVVDAAVALSRRFDRTIVLDGVHEGRSGLLVIRGDWVQRAAQDI